MLRVSLEDDDYNTADLICSEIQKYKYSKGIQLLVDELVAQVMNLEADAAIETIGKIRKEW